MQNILDIEEYNTQYDISIMPVFKLWSHHLPRRQCLVFFFCDAASTGCTNPSTHRKKKTLKNNGPLPSLKLTVRPLKMHGWKMILSFWVSAYFQGRTAKLREDN